MVNLEVIRFLLPWIKQQNWCQAVSAQDLCSM